MSAETNSNQESPRPPDAGCYACLLFQRLIGPDKEEPHFHVVLTKPIELPFVPSKGISLGLETGNHFQNDETKLSRVMWHQGTNKFHIECEIMRGCGATVAEYYLRDGWVLDLQTDVRFSDKDDALSSAAECGDETVIEFRGGFYTLTPSQLWCLVKDGRTFEIVSA